MESQWTLSLVDILKSATRTFLKKGEIYKDASKEQICRTE